MTGRVLVIGWGNPLRGDDGLGWHAAALLADDQRLAGTTVLACHQLTPELAEDVAGASLVILVDARDGGDPAGSISIEPVHAGQAGRPALTHHVEPAALAELARRLYGRAPRMVLVSVSASSLEIGDRLSPALSAALGEVVTTVAELAGDATSNTGPPA